MLIDKKEAESRISFAEEEIKKLNEIKPSGYEIEIEYRESLIARWKALIKGEKK